MSQNSQPWALDIVTAGARMREGRLTPSALLASVLERVNQADPIVHAFVSVDRERAERQAEVLDAELRQGNLRGPLHGIPIAVKDLFDIAGLPTRSGSKSTYDAPPAIQDSTVVTRLKAAGAIVFAKSTTHEFAIGDYTPGTLNPWDLERTAGGSSGGSASAVASGTAIAAVGSDTGGSIRNPAGECGIVGLKATYGRVSRAGGTVMSWSLDHVGPLAQTVDDAAHFITAIAGPDPRDPTATTRPMPDLFLDPGTSLEGRRIGVPQECFLDVLEPAVREALEASRAVFTDLGATVIDLSIPETRWTVPIEYAIILGEAGSYHARTLPHRAHLLGLDEQDFLESASLLPASAYVKAQRARAALQRAFHRAFIRERLDAFLSPSCFATALRFDEKVVNYDGRPDLAADAFVRTTAPYNLAGMPAIALPYTVGPNGLPIGIQLAARPYAEDTLITIARAFERAVDWRGRRLVPPGLARALRNQETG